MKCCFSTIFSLMTIILLSTQGIAYSHEYAIEQECVAQPQLVLSRVVVTDEETIVDMEWRASENQKISVYPPQHNMAFCITDITEAQKYQLLDVKGVPIIPDFEEVKEGDLVKFSLVFEKIPSDMKQFNLLEGTNDKPGLVEWNFRGVTLE